MKKDGETTSITGTAKNAGEGEPGQLLVRFDRFPANLVAGDYWVLDVNENYTRALVGSPDKKFLWLLSKNSGDSRGDFSRQISKARTLGYATDSLYFNPQRVQN